MKYGLDLSAVGPCGDPNTMAQLARLAEDSGWDGVFLEDFGELTSPKDRARALDESLDVLAALWSGEPVTYHGRFVTVDDVQLPARPVQRPRIPIWVGGCAALPGPRQRALRWDGSCLYGAPPPTWTDLNDEDVRDLKQDAREAGKDDFVVAVGGRPRHEDLGAEQEYVTSLAVAGADWWSEYVPPESPVDAARALIAAGPIRARL